MSANPATVAANPAKDLSIRAWVWLSMHRKVSFTLAFLACCLVSNFILIDQAQATGQSGEGTVPVVGFPASGITDTHGVPVSRYLELPFDSGNVTHPVRSARYVIASFLWTLYAGPLIALLAMVDWILTFEWLEWIAAPFVLVANTIRGLMDGIGIVGVAVAVTALAIAIAFLRGRRSSAWVELAMVILMFGIVASPLANPAEWVTGESGAVQTARDYGMEAGELSTPGGGNTSPEGSIVSGVIVDMTLRDPMLTMSWGSDLATNQECTDRWNHNALDPANSAGDIRTEVNSCDDAAQDANETDSFIFLAPFGIGLTTALGVMFLVGVFLVFLLLAVCQALIGSVNTVIKGYFALFPGGGRYAFFNALAQTVLAVISIGLFIWLLVLYLWGINYVEDLMPATGAHLGLLMGLLVLAMAITFITLKIKGKKAGEAIARMLGRTGLSNSAPANRAPSAFKQGVAQALPSSASSAMRKLQRGRKLRRAAKLASAAATGGAATVAATSATAVARQAASRTVASAGARVAAGGTRTPADAGTPAKAETGARPAGTAPAPAAAGEASSMATQQPMAVPPPAPRPELAAGAPERRAGSEGAMERREEAPHPEPVTSRQGATATTVPAPPQRRPSPPQGARKSTLPPGRYGTVWVHANGESTTVLSGPNSPMPSREKVGRVWNIASPDVPVARSQREPAAAASPAPEGGVALRLHQEKQDQRQGNAGQRIPRPMRKEGN
jgi:hypothetical protein